MQVDEKEYNQFLEWKKAQEYNEFLEWKKKQPVKVYKPEPGEIYYFIELDGTIKSTRWSGDTSKWFGRLDLALYALGNCFKTIEEAEFVVEKLKVIAELKRFAQEHNDPIDWKNINQEKWTFVYHHQNKVMSVYVDAHYYLEHANNTYFSSEELCQQAIQAIGEDRIKKYYLEVK